MPFARPSGPVAVCVFAIVGAFVLVPNLWAADEAVSAKPSIPTIAAQQIYAGKQFVHAPVARGSCTDCHDSDFVGRPALLKEPVVKLCTSCHKEMVPKLGQTLSTHAPAQDNCMECHDPHASDLKHLLKQAEPELCLSCHKQLKDSLASSSVVHGAMAQEGSCTKCHSPHLSKLHKLQKEPQPELCLSCHDRPLQTAGGRPLTNMAALLKDSPEHHGPIRLGACTVT